MYEIWVSHNAGISYKKEYEAEKVENLVPAMKKLDKEMLRWYLAIDGKQIYTYTCAIHQGIIDLLEKLDEPPST